MLKSRMTKSCLEAGMCRSPDKLPVARLSRGSAGGVAHCIQQTMFSYLSALI